MRSAQVALSKPGLCSDPAQPRPSLAVSIPAGTSAPRPAGLPSGGDREHTALLQALCLKCFSSGKPRSCLCFWQLPCPLALVMQSLLLAPCLAVPRAQLSFIDWVGLQELGEMHEEGWICHQTGAGSCFICCFPPSQAGGSSFTPMLSGVCLWAELWHLQSSRANTEECKPGLS